MKLNGQRLTEDEAEVYLGISLKSWLLSIDNSRESARQEWKYLSILLSIVGVQLI